MEEGEKLRAKWKPTVLRSSSTRSDVKVGGTQDVLEPHVAPGGWNGKGDVWSGGRCGWVGIVLFSRSVVSDSL